jgi:hypothetical protein
MPEGYSPAISAAVRRTAAAARGRRIKTWKQFARHVRAAGCALLKRLDEFPESVLVTGCQRSGTTMLTRIIAQSEGMVDFRSARDDELDAALILSGHMEYVSQGRHCFQTTYLNECYREYFEHRDRHKMIWVLRHPASVVYSLVHHWSRFALTELFDACGAQFLSEARQRRYRAWGTLSTDRLERACLSYMGKTHQLFDIVDRIGTQRLMIVDYDQLVKEKARILPQIYRFIDIPYKPVYAERISTGSLGKFQKLSAREQERIKTLCEPVYRHACAVKQDLEAKQLRPVSDRLVRGVP